MVLNHHGFELDIVFKNSLQHVGMVMQILFITKFGFRSESTWWYKHSLDEKHLEIVANQFVTEDNVK